MTGASLIRWSSLEEKRRKAALSGVQGWPGPVLSLILGSLLAAEILRRLWLASDDELLDAALGASHLWVAAAICGFAIGVFGAPFLLYWRRDSKLLASLPVPGRSLFALALYRSHRSAMLVSLALLLALLPLGWFTTWGIALRHLVLLILGITGSAWLGPAAALSAGAIVASDKAQAVIASMSGEFQAPRTSWLGIMPGVAATMLTVAIMAAAPWAIGKPPIGGSIVVLLALGTVAPALALWWAWSKADQVIAAAVREVAALDQEILAHVERSTPSFLEHSLFKALLKSETRLLATKDASLARRRYPSPYFMIPVGVAVTWILAIAQPSSYLPWTGSIYGGLVVYAMVMAGRTWTSPIEIPRLLQSLALGRTQVAKAKGIQFLLRLGSIVILAGVPLIARAPEQFSAFIFVLLVTLAGAALSYRSEF